MGLFDTLHHGRLAILSFADGHMHSELDQLQDGLYTTFQEAWDQHRLENVSEFLNMPTIAIAALMTSMFLLHVLVSTIILKIMPNDKAFSNLVVQGFHSLISPPLHIDWEYYYRLNDKRESVLKCWKR